METKICSKCEIEKPIEDFAFRDKKRGTRRAECKACISARQREKYHRNRQILDDLKKQQKCEKCGENRFYLLDFHHIDPSTKEKNVSRFSSNSSLNKALAEMKKCICLCANCHREFHYLEKEKGITLEEYLK